MPIATGNEFINPSNDNSVGAYIFPEGSIDPLQAQKNVNKDVADALDDALAKDAAKKKAAIDNLDAMTKDIDFNKKGALEQDIPYFQQAQQNILTNFKDRLVQNKGLDPNSPEYYKNVTYPTQVEINKAKSEALISAGHKEAFGKDILEAATHPYKYNLEGVQSKIAQLRLEPDINKRDAAMSKLGYTTLTPGFKDWTTLVSARTKELSEHQLDEKTVPVSIGQQVGAKEIKSLSNEKVADIANNDLMSPEHQKSLNDAWDRMSTTNKDLYSEQLKHAQESSTDATGKPTEFGRKIAAWSPIQYFAYKSYRDQLPTQEKVTGLKFTPGAEAEAKAQTAEEKLYNRYGYLYDMTEGIVNEKPQMFDNYDSKSKSYYFRQGHEGELVSTQFKPFSIGTRPEQYIASYKADGTTPSSFTTKIVPDKVVAVMKKKGDQNTVYVKPESEIIRAKAEHREPKFIPYDANSFAETVFSNNTIDEKGKPDPILGADAMKYHAKKRGQINNGVVDFTQNPTPGSNVKAPLGEGKAVPVEEMGKNTPAMLPTFSRKDLLSSGKGWTDEKIDKAVSLGKFNISK